MAGEVVMTNVSDRVATLTFNRPDKLNALSPELITQSIEALSRWGRDPAVGAIVVTGAGRAFCAGDDLREFASQATGEAATRAYVERIQDVTRAIVLGDTPVIAAVRGWAAGGGLEWTINCDFAIAADGTRFFFPELALGLFVTGGVTDMLPRLVGLRRARELIMLGEKFDAAQAYAWGLLSRVVADDALEAAACDIACRVAALPAARVTDLKRILAGRHGGGLRAAMAAETEATVRGFLDPDTARRVAAFP